MRAHVFGWLGVILCGACGGGTTTSGSHVDTASSASAGAQGAVPPPLTVGDGGGGNGGANAGTGGSVANGSAGTAGLGLNVGGSSDPGGPTSITLHQCPGVPDPSCPTKVLTGDYNSGAGVAALTGVTSITGRVYLTSIDELNALSCLETVGDDLSIDLFAPEMELSLWPLRNLKKIGGGIEIESGLTHTWVDCGLSNLQSLGDAYFTGGAVDASDVSGYLNLSALTEVTHIRIKNTNLTRVTLPSNASLVMGQLWFDTNPNLTTVDGFESVLLKQSSIMVQGAQSVRIVQNPKLSTCRANELKAAFVAAGFSATDMVLQNNLPDCQ